MSGTTTSLWLRSIGLALLSSGSWSCEEPKEPLVLVSAAEVTGVLEEVLRDLSSERNERYVIPREHNTGFLDFIDWREESEGLQGTVPDSLLTDFASRATVSGLVRLPSTAIGIHSMVEARDLTFDPIPLPQEYWARFYREFPGSNGVVSFSPVGFSSDRTHAMVYVEHAFYETGGKGVLFLCTLVDGAWTVSQRFLQWIS